MLSSAIKIPARSMTSENEKKVALFICYVMGYTFKYNIVIWIGKYVSRYYLAHDTTQGSVKRRLDRRRIKVGHTHAAWLFAQLCVSTANTTLIPFRCSRRLKRKWFSFTHFYYFAFIATLPYNGEYSCKETKREANFRVDYIITIN